MDSKTSVPALPMSLALAAGLLLGTPSTPAAHEIPADVTVRMLVKPQGDRLVILVRAPLAAMRDVEFPSRDGGRWLDLEGIEPRLGDAARLWIADYLDVWEDGARAGAPEVVSARLSLPTDRSFGGWERARAHLRGAPLTPDTRLLAEQALMDVLLEAPIRSERSELALEPALAHLGIRTLTVLRFYTPSGQERVYQYPGNPGLVRLDPRWHHAAFHFVALGFEHILDGLDHLLFLLCLVLPFRSLRGLVPVVTAFTVAHSLTLGASVLGLAPDALWFPPLVETLIALSIVWMALENIMGVGVARRWTIAFGFGLVHGFGFSFALRESLQFAGGHLAVSLLSFNVGVELGQLAVLGVMVPATAFFLHRLHSERVGVVVVSALVAHTGWHWMTARGSEFLQYDFAWPAPDLFLVADLMRWGVLALIAAGSVWLLRGLYDRFPDAPAAPTAPKVSEDAAVPAET